MTLEQKILNVVIVILFGILFIAQTGEVSSLPPELLRPQYGEEPRFPQDYVIGNLGRCDASAESYRFARLLSASLAVGDGKTEGLLFPDQKRFNALQNIAGLGIRSWRVGGGRVEPDGSDSFLIRFLGREKSVTGELFLRRIETGAEDAEALGEIKAWFQVDDILLEKPSNLSEGKFGPNKAGMTPYERFF